MSDLHEDVELVSFCPRTIGDAQVLTVQDPKDRLTWIATIKIMIMGPAERKDLLLGRSLGRGD